MPYRTETPCLCDDTPERRALRALQIADASIPAQMYADHPRARGVVMDLQSQLGRAIGLRCTGVYHGGGFWEHDGDTCPIHEWLVHWDAEHAEDVRLLSTG